MPAPVPLQFSDLEAPETFFAKGFGNNDSMLLASPDGLLEDRELVRKLLLLGRSEIKFTSKRDNLGRKNVRTPVSIAEIGASSPNEFQFRHRNAKVFPLPVLTPFRTG